MAHDYNDNLSCPKYEVVSISKLLRDREIGRSRCRFTRNFVDHSENTYCSEEVVRSLYCDKYAYLETVVCKKVPRTENPAFCRGRLFTNNYQSWYNLCTAPSTEPQLMTKNIFAEINTRSGSSSAPSSESKIIDSVCVIHPFGCASIMNKKRIGPQLLLLSKSGWLYQADVESGQILNSIFIPTKSYANSLFDPNHHPADISDENNNATTHSNKKFVYRHLTVNRVFENVIIKTSRTISNSGNENRFMISTAFCILKLYPLSLYCHFVTEVSTYSTNPSYSVAVVNDFFIVTAVRQSKITFYCLEDVINHYLLPNKVTLKKKVSLRYSNEWPYYTERTVGDSSLGIPFTMRNISLDSFVVSPPVPVLFKTAAMKHSLQIGCSPYHYIIALNRNGTIWSLRHLLGTDSANSSPVRLNIDEKWDGTHWNGIRFHNDDTGRVIKQDSNSVELLSIVHDGTCLLTHDSTSQVCCDLRSDFLIDVTPKARGSIKKNSKTLLSGHSSAHVMFSLITRTCDFKGSESLSSRGRPLRHSGRLLTSSQYGSDDFNDDEDYLLVTVQFDYDLNLLFLLYYRPKGDPTPGWEIQDEGAELVVSVHDNYTGCKLASFILENDVSPSNRDYLSLAVDKDTMVYTRLRCSDNRCQYTVLRLFRHFGEPISLKIKSSS